MSQDKYHGVGGSYSRDPKTGERRQVERPTERHKDGDCARDADGKPLNVASDKIEPAFAPPASPAAPAPAAPAPSEPAASDVAPAAESARTMSRKGA